MNSAVTAQEAGPRYLSGATPSDSPRANVSSDATAPGPTYSLQPTTCIQKVIWDIQVSSAPGTSAAGESLPAISVSLWDAQAVDASASANGLHGISLEAKDVSLKLRNSPEKPQRFECTASGALSHDVHHIIPWLHPVRSAYPAAAIIPCTVRYFTHTSSHLKRCNPTQWHIHWNVLDSTHENRTSMALACRIEDCGASGRFSTLRSGG